MPKFPRPYKRTGSRSGRPRTLLELLKAAGASTDVQEAVSQGAEGLERSREWLRGLLPPELAPHVVHALERRGELVVFTESAAWAGRLTLALAELREKLAPRVAPDSRVTVRVVPGGRYRR